MREPVSVITNAAYPVAALIVGFYGGWDTYSTVFFIQSALLGIASGGYHATLSRSWQRADEVAMYGFFGSMLVMGMVVNAVSPHAIGIVVGITASLMWFREQADSHIWVPLLVLSNMIAAGMAADWRFAIFGLHIYLAAVVLRYLGEQGKGEGDLRGHDAMHGAWHILTAIANAWVFMCYSTT